MWDIQKWFIFRVFQHHIALIVWIRYAQILVRLSATWTWIYLRGLISLKIVIKFNMRYNILFWFSDFYLLINNFVFWLLMLSILSKIILILWAVSIIIHQRTWIENVPVIKLRNIWFCLPIDSLILSIANLNLTSLCWFSNLNILGVIIYFRLNRIS